MKDNALKYCTTIAFSAAMLAFALSGFTGEAGGASGLTFCLQSTAALWLIVCFGSPIAAGFRRLMAADMQKSDAMQAKDQGGKES